ncbi:unnamed protein product [Effrenium voratum]|uniref:Uncharacterized protein n=1 Tax=Effrenium voratum TaxID=2562239 RepID=A0AA36N6I0_9DINO|nr:unnamed protein product [Effrenium voratum]CAJ1454929.1 unnamed protein product [Effrenium voratum]
MKLILAWLLTAAAVQDLGGFEEDPQGVFHPRNADDGGDAEVLKADVADVKAEPAPVVEGDVQEVAGGGQVAAAPVKEVLRVLRALSKRVDLRDRREKKIYEEFGQYCLKGSGSLEKSLKESQAELPHLQLGLVEAERRRQALLEEMQVHENEAAGCKSALAGASAIRQEELKAYEKELATLTGNQRRLQELLAQDGTALAQLSRGAQNSSESLRLSLSSSSTAELLELLQDPGATQGQKIQVMEMLRNMLEGVGRDLAELKAQELKRATGFRAMERAKAEELQSLQRSLQQKKERDAAFQKQMASLRLEREDTAAVVDDADKLTKSLSNWCEIRRGQHTEMQLKMQEESKTLQSASKLLLGGGLEGFQPVVTFLQLAQRHQHSMAAEVKSNSSALRRSLRGKGGPALAKITKLVDSMVTVLEKDQEDDDLKIQMCKDELASSQDAQTALSEKEQGKAADIASLSEQLENLERDVAAEKKAISRVDWVVATASTLREKEHKHLATSIAQGAAAVDVLHKATNSLEKYLQEGGVLLQTDRSDDEEFGFLTESAKGSDASVALRALEAVKAAVRSEVDQVKLRETADQAAYVALLGVARSSRRKDAYTLTDFVGGQAALAAEAQRILNRQKALKEQMGLTDQLVSTLKEECDKLMANYEAQKLARRQEIEALHAKKKALEASLAGVDLQ